jgi:hypothetical protein
MSDSLALGLVQAIEQGLNALWMLFRGSLQRRRVVFEERLRSVQAIAFGHLQRA